MKLQAPVMRGTIDRRILANFRVNPESLTQIVPPPFRPKLVRGWGIAGVCLIRLKHTRPPLAPAFAGLASENAAHRIAVEWDENGVVREGVFIPRRDTSSRLQSWVGGRIFPGVHHLADFHVEERADFLRVEMRSRDDREFVLVEGSPAKKLPRDSVFRNSDEASTFFERGALGYSSTPDAGIFDGLELRTFRWEVIPFDVSRIRSSFFEDARRFPPGSIQFDGALLMRGIEHEWHAREPLQFTGTSATYSTKKPSRHSNFFSVVELVALRRVAPRSAVRLGMGKSENRGLFIPPAIRAGLSQARQALPLFS